jgi:endonuclease III
MKRGSEYAKRIKQLYQRLIRKFGKPELPEPTDPIHQLIVGILSENTAESKATSLFKRICEQMVDLNELRVTPPMELADLIGSSVPQGREKAYRVIRVLNEVRARQDALDLSFLKQRGRREAREYLESLEGVGLYAAASVMVHSLGGHAIPVDFLTIYVLRKEDVVEGSANQAEVQGFLERNVAAADTPSFVALLNRHVVTEGARVSVNRLPDLLNLAPLELPRPKRNGMERPAVSGARVGGDPDVAVAGLVVDEESPDESLPDLTLEEAASDDGTRARKSGGNTQKKRKKPPPPPPAPRARKSGEKTAKSKERESSARKRKG